MCFLRYSFGEINMFLKYKIVGGTAVESLGDSPTLIHKEPNCGPVSLNKLGGKG